MDAERLGYASGLGVRLLGGWRGPRRGGEGAGGEAPPLCKPRPPPRCTLFCALPPPFADAPRPHLLAELFLGSVHAAQQQQQQQQQRQPA